MISVLIPTKNEEVNLPGCLALLKWTDDVYVYDSGSSDATAAIAEQNGARLIPAPFDTEKKIFGGNEAEHRNWALRNIPFKYPWVLLIDADERVTPELAVAMRRAVAHPDNNVAFLMRRRDFFLGTWLKHVQASPFYMRLFRPEQISFTRLINTVPVPQGQTSTIPGYLDHYPFNRGIEHWLNRHNSYSSLEAAQIAENRRQNLNPSLRAAILSNDPTERRFHQKAIFYRLPARPLIKFLVLYLAKLGVLDGRAGLAYAILQSFYEYMIVLKTREIQTETENPEIAARAIKALADTK